MEENYFSITCVCLDIHQPNTVPQKIYLKLRRLSGSFFRALVDKSDGNPVKQYDQPVASYRTIKFNRFQLSDVKECKERKGKTLLIKFTQMNVWTHNLFWDGEYPKGPDDIVCPKSQQRKKNELTDTCLSGTECDSRY